MKKILVTIPASEKHREYLESIAPSAEFCYTSEKNVTREEIEAADIILGAVPAPLLTNAEKLEFLQLSSAGAVPYVQPGILRKGVKLANASGAYGRSIAEYMLGMTLTLMKKLNAYHSNMALHQWKDEGHVPMILGSSVLVLGLGDIGGEYARRMNALGAHVTGIRRNRSPKPEYLDVLYQMDMLDQLLPEADIVACSLPGTDETEHLLNAEKLSLMKKGSILINVGRGSLIPTEDLINALKNGPLGAAGIDVAEQEPLSPESELWDIPNLLITPHISGCYHTDDILNTIVSIAGENLRAFMNNEPISHEVDFTTGYRKFILPV